MNEAVRYIFIYLDIQPNEIFYTHNGIYKYRIKEDLMVQYFDKFDKTWTDLPEGIIFLIKNPTLIKKI